MKVLIHFHGFFRYSFLFFICYQGDYTVFLKPLEILTCFAFDSFHFVWFLVDDVLVSCEVMRGLSGEYGYSPPFNSEACRTGFFEHI